MDKKEDIFKSKISRRGFLKTSVGVLSAACLSGGASGVFAQDRELDIIIKGGTIVNGSGEVSYTADLGIKGNLIEIIGDLSSLSAGRIIDASGLIVSPGFIDMHTHYGGITRPDLPDTPTENKDGNLYERLNEALLLQGITSVIGGNCGYSALNLTKHFNIINKKGLSFNYGTLIGHASMRKKLFGDSKITVLTEQEKNSLKQMLEKALVNGAFGLSTEFEQSCASLAPSKELVELSEVLVPYRAFLAIHRRNETDDVINSTKEAVDICERGKVRTQISHFRAIGRANWNKHEEMAGVLQRAVGKKLPIKCDFYPYDSCQGYLDYIFPGWAKKGGPLIENLKDKTIRERVRIHSPELFSLCSPENIIIFSKAIPDITGKNLIEAGEILGISPAECATELVLNDKSKKGGPVIYRYAIAKGNYEDLIKSSFAVFSSDGGINGEEDFGSIDPRIYGTFPKIFGSYVRDKKSLSIEEAVRRATLLPAEQLRLEDRGLLKEKMVADIAIFNLSTIADKSTYENPTEFPKGIEYVIVNGNITVDSGKYNCLRKGVILKKFVL